MYAWWHCLVLCTDAVELAGETEGVWWLLLAGCLRVVALC